MSIYSAIAYHEGELFTEFGPCLCGGDTDKPCLSCVKANEIKEHDLDWEEEYQDWRKARKDTDHA